MNICIDIDDILCDLVPTGIALYNEKAHKNIQLSDITSFHLHECLDTNDADEILAIFRSKEIYDYLSPIPDSQWGVRSLMECGHHVFLATATPYDSFSNKVEWVCKHFTCVTPNDIICIQDKSILNCDVMVDDKLDNLTKSLCERVILNYPWNISTSKDYAYDIYRCHNWLDIADTINKIERKYKEWMETTIMEET